MLITVENKPFSAERPDTTTIIVGRYGCSTSPQQSFVVIPMDGQIKEPCLPAVHPSTGHEFRQLRTFSDANIAASVLEKFDDAIQTAI